MTVTRQRGPREQPVDLTAQASRRLPLSAGSLIVTLFGDVIEPRGGSIGLGDLTRLLEPFGLNSGQIRTALSRLVADGWLARRRDGRRSTYCVAPARTEEFRHAMDLVYHAHERALDGLEHVVILEDDAGRRAAIREQLIGRGYGQLAPNLLIRPLWRGQGRDDVPLPAGSAVRSRLDTSDADASALAKLGAAGWPLGDACAAYDEAIEVLRPIWQATRAAVDGAEAYQARILAVHAFRRACLKDPQLPACLLPDDWPGFEALARVADIYATTLKSCDRWLDDSGFPLSEPHRYAVRFRDTKTLQK